MTKRALVAGAGGFIGGHLVKRLLDEGYKVRAIDLKPSHEWHQWHGPSHPEVTAGASWDLRDASRCRDACRGMDEVYNLAADMGGMGFIETHKYECMQSVLINTNLLNAAIGAGVRKYFFSSSACIYPQALQVFGGHTERWSLAEVDAYPADPEDGYGWEKLFSERMCRHAYEDRGLEVRVGRYHNVYGPHGTWEGGREKAPAAMCRKVAEVMHGASDTLEIWGNGDQLRSFMYVDDCIEGTRRLMESDYTGPLNIGSSELVSINGLACLVEDLASVLNKRGYPVKNRIPRAYNRDAPKGVQGRNSDNTLIKQVLGWEPQERLAAGLISTYAWVEEQVKAKLGK